MLPATICCLFGLYKQQKNITCACFKTSYVNQKYVFIRYFFYMPPLVLIAHNLKFLPENMICILVYYFQKLEVIYSLTM